MPKFPEFHITPGSVSGSFIVRYPWYRRGRIGRLLNWFKPKQKPMLWATATFDEPIHVKNGDTLKMSYTIERKDEPEPPPSLMRQACDYQLTLLDMMRKKDKNEPDTPPTP